MELKKKRFLANPRQTKNPKISKDGKMPNRIVNKGIKFGVHITIKGMAFEQCEP